MYAFLSLQATDMQNAQPDRRTLELHEGADNDKRRWLPDSLTCSGSFLWKES